MIRGLLIFILIFSLGLGLTELKAQERTVTGSVVLKRFSEPSSSGRIGLRYGGIKQKQQTSSPNTPILLWVESDIPTNADDTPKKLDQENLQFQPQLVIVLQGGDVRILNSDPVYHNVFSLSDTKSFDVGRRPKGEYLDVTFDKTGEVDVFCDIHSSMSATILVLPNTAARWKIISENELFSLSVTDNDVAVHVYAPGFEEKMFTLTKAKQQELGQITLTQ